MVGEIQFRDVDDFLGFVAEGLGVCFPEERGLLFPGLALQFLNNLIFILKLVFLIL